MILRNNDIMVKFIFVSNTRDKNGTYHVIYNIFTKQK